MFEKLDWLGSSLGIAGAVLTMIDMRLASIIWIISNVAWIGWAMWKFRTAKSPIVAQNVYYMLNNATVLFVRWDRP